MLIDQVLKKAGYNYHWEVLNDYYDDSDNPIKAVQYILAEYGHAIGKIDGLYGPKTEAAINEFLGVKPWRPGTPETGQFRLNWPKYNDMNRFYGRVGSNQVRLKLPYKMKIAWDTSKTINSFKINAKCHDSALRVLNNTLGHYGHDGIRELGLDLFGGCLNVRKIRGGTRYSTHSWGAAIDFDPARNGLRTKAPFARLSSNDAVKFWEFWEQEGWVSLGRSKNYDWMHVQAVT